MPKESAVNREIVRQLQQALKYLGADPALADIAPVDLYKKLEALGADRDILTIVGSSGDTLDDEEVLDLLKGWNAAERRARN
jgi:CO dehydrogenase/acetyl-CoA synthase delta subunit